MVIIFVMPYHYVELSETYWNSYLPSTIKLWNNLPEQLVEQDNLNEFKNYLEFHLFPYIFPPIINYMIICVVYST